MNCKKNHILHEITLRLLKIEHIFMPIIIGILMSITLVNKVFLLIPLNSKTLSTRKCVKLTSIYHGPLAIVKCIGWSGHPIDGVNVNLVSMLVTSKDFWVPIRNRQWFSLGLTDLVLPKPNQLILNHFGVLKIKPNWSLNRFRLNRLRLN